MVATADEGPTINVKVKQMETRTLSEKKYNGPFEWEGAVKPARKSVVEARLGLISQKPTAKKPKVTPLDLLRPCWILWAAILIRDTKHNVLGFGGELKGP